MQIDQTSYNKAAAHPPGYGYEARKAAPTSIVVHSTSSSIKNTNFVAESKFLFNSALVSAHYLIGRDGAIVQFLDPLPWAAWHAGNARVDFVNQRSVGIELHHSVGDPPYPKAQLDALADLLRTLMTHFAIPVDKIETHGQIAIQGPYQRKTDPSDMSYQAFLRFRSALVSAPPPPTVRPYRVKAAMFWLENRRPDAPIANQGRALLQVGDVVAIDDVTNGWAHAANSIGFTLMAGLEAL